MVPLHISEFGVFLGKHSERLVVRKGKEVLSEHPLMDLEQVLVTGHGCSISTDLIHECCRRGIPLNLLTPRGTPFGCLTSPVMTATVRTRREQIAAYLDGRGARIARAMAAGKVANQANLLRYFGKYRKGRDAGAEEVARLAVAILALAKEIETLPGETADAVRPQLMNREGRAGAHYWTGFALLLRGKVEFPGREHRGSADPVNAALNYGYGVLQAQVTNAISLAGLEPFGGFIHVDRSGRPSMVLDLMEEFRQPVVDRAILAALGRGWKPQMEASEEAEDDETARLSQPARQEIAARVFQRLAAPAPYDGKKQALKNIIQLQARRLAVAVRGEQDYAPFMAGW